MSCVSVTSYSLVVWTMCNSVFVEKTKKLNLIVDYIVTKDRIITVSHMCGIHSKPPVTRWHWHVSHAWRKLNVSVHRLCSLQHRLTQNKPQNNPKIFILKLMNVTSQHFCLCIEMKNQGKNEQLQGHVVSLVRIAVYIAVGCNTAHVPPW